MHRHDPRRAHREGPRPEPRLTPDGWLDRYDKRVQKATGHRLEKLPASLCPPRNQGQLWIATIAEDGPADHCVVARGHFIVHDPASLYQGLLPPKDRLVDGLLLMPTRRLVRDLHPHRNGWQIVPA